MIPACRYGFIIQTGDKIAILPNCKRKNVQNILCKRISLH